jgi:hypothetical protein
MLDQSVQTLGVGQQTAQNQTEAPRTITTGCQMEPLSKPSSEIDKQQVAILKMSNSVLFQEIQGMQRAHDAVVKEMQDRMASENEYVFFF